MNRFAFLSLLPFAACAPSYTSGHTQCSDLFECPSGFICGNDGSGSGNVCLDNNKAQCDSSSNYYCPQTDTCWTDAPVECSTVFNCGTMAAPDYQACGSLGYSPDCTPGATTCIVDPSGTGGSGGSTGKGTGGATGSATGGSGGSGKDGGLQGGGGGGSAGKDGGLQGGGDGGGGGKDGGLQGDASRGVSTDGGLSGGGGVGATVGSGSGGLLLGTGGVMGSGGTTSGTGPCSAVPCFAALISGCSPTGTCVQQDVVSLTQDTSTYCYASGVKEQMVATASSSATLGTITLKNATRVCYSMLVTIPSTGTTASYMFKDAAGNQVATAVQDTNTNFLTMTCNGGSPTQVSGACWLAGVGSGIGSNTCTIGVCAF